MPDNVTGFWVHALSPIHVGVGTGTGYIDQPVNRETVTGWPYIPSSSAKGVLADHFDATDDNRRNNPLLSAAFGIGPSATTDQAAENAGALQFNDLHLVCLPVRSVYGTFAWVTSSLVLRRLSRDLADLGFTDLPSLPTDFESPEEIRLPSGSVLAGGPDRNASHVYFENLRLKPRFDDSAATAWTVLGAHALTDSSWQKLFAQRFAIVSDQVFDFLAETATEVVTRIQIDDVTGRVKDGHLWTEERLPAESILFGYVACDRVLGHPGMTQQQVMTLCPAGKPLRLQFGGKRSVGCGVALTQFPRPASFSSSSPVPA